MKAIRIFFVLTIFLVLLCLTACKCKKEVYGSNSDYIDVSHPDSSIMVSSSDGETKNNAANPTDNSSKSTSNKQVNSGVGKNENSSSKNESEYDGTNLNSNPVSGDDYGPAVSVP